MARCLRCGATSEWIEGRTRREPGVIELLRELNEIAGDYRGEWPELADAVERVLGSTHSGEVAK